jgi:hypothetical protein
MADYFYKLHTLFDLTKTGVLRGYSPSVLGLKDSAGQIINTEADWQRSRNQQRNWETIIQLLCLRAQPTAGNPVRLDNQLISQFDFDPVYGEHATVWTVTFSVETAEVYADNKDPVAFLRSDFDRIPMIANLTESVVIDPALIITNPPGRNTTFTSIVI